MERVQHTGSALYANDTKEIDGTALRLAPRAGLEVCLSGLKIGGGHSRGDTGAEEGGGDDGREVYSGPSGSNVRFESLWSIDT